MTTMALQIRSAAAALVAEAGAGKGHGFTFIGAAIADAPIGLSRRRSC
jgi:hypothetical protein